MSDKVEVAATVKVKDEASAPIQGVERAMQSLHKAAESISKGFGGKMFAGLKSELGSVMGALGTFTKSVAALFGISAGFSIAGAVSGVQDYVDRAKQLSRMAPLLGTTVEKLDLLHYAAKRSGVSFETFDSAVARANRNITVAAQGGGKGGKKLASFFQELHIPLKDAKGNITNVIDILPQLADAFKKTGDKKSGMKLEAATMLFGRGVGIDMVRMLNKGAAGLEEFYKAAVKAGVMTQEDVNRALKFSGAQKKVAEAYESLSFTLSQALLPILEPVINQVSALLERFKPQIVAAMTGAFKYLGTWIGSINWTKLIEDVGGFATAVGKVLEPLGGFQTLLVGVAAYFFPWATLFGLLVWGAWEIYKNWDRLPQLFAEVQTAVGNALTEMGTKAQELAQKFVPQPIQEAWQSFKKWWDADGPASGSFFTIPDNALPAALNRVQQPMGPEQPEREAGSSGWHFFPTAEDIKRDIAENERQMGEIKAAWGRIVAAKRSFEDAFGPGTTLQERWGALSEWFNTTFGASIKKTFDDADARTVAFLKGVVPDAIKAAWIGLPKWFEGQWKEIEDMFTAFTTWLQTWVTGPLGKAIDAIVGAVGRIGDAFRSGTTPGAPSTPTAPSLPQFTPGYSPTSYHPGQDIIGGGVGNRGGAARQDVAIKSEGQLNINIRSPVPVEADASGTGLLRNPNLNLGQSMPALA